MVLGRKSKDKRVTSVTVDYIVHIEEIRPWPPSESLKSVQTVLLQWEHGNQVSGSFLSVAGDSSIAFNESFMLHVALYRDKKIHDKFKKNYLEFSLIEPRKDKAKGQVLGTVSVNLADYGVMEDATSIKTPMIFKKSASNSIQPALYISLELVERDGSNSSHSAGLSKEYALEYDDNGSEIASFTDDDSSSYSSRAAGSSTIDSVTASPSQNDKIGYGNAGIDFAKEQNRSSRPSSNDSLSNSRNHTSDYVSFSKFSERSLTSVKNCATSPSIISSPASISFREMLTRPDTITPSFARESSFQDPYEVIVKSRGSTRQYKEDKELKLDVSINDSIVGPVSITETKEQNGNGYSEWTMEESMRFPADQFIKNLSDDTAQRRVTRRSDTLVPSKKAPLVPLPENNKARLKHVKSVQIPGPKGNKHLAELYNGGKETGINIWNGSQMKDGFNEKIERKVQTDDHIDHENEWKTRIEMLEEELKEAAAVEIALYSVVAEHSSSGNKVHISARRLSRFYINICRARSPAKRASAARAAVSGLILVSKACGNDVSRLTYWLSNSIMLRAIISQIAAELPHSNVRGTKSELESSGRVAHTQLDSCHRDREDSKSTEEFDDWEDVLTFIIALEKVESWLFSRIVESLWWQTFTPHMQPAVAKSTNTSNATGIMKANARKINLNIYEQGNFSTELWKKAFKDACERLCPIRAGGDKCGCLSELVRLVMEQLVNRLDVSMFNAILRESAEEMPTDPFCDPISDSKVLPIPAGKSSFGAGAQLKNAIGNWSRWLTDLFGIEEDIYEDTNIENGKIQKSFKAFRLLHALSDLMMLPFSMLSDASTRKEVCPTFGPTIIRRVLNNFVPDEFCPHPIPRGIINALDSEDLSHNHGYLLTAYPCTATPMKYAPPAAALLTCVGEVGKQVLQSSRLSTLKKSHASDDELDEVDSPLTSIIPDSFLSSSALAKLSLMPKEKGGRNSVRYQLLREIWTDDEW